MIKKAKWKSFLWVPRVSPAGGHFFGAVASIFEVSGFICLLRLQGPARQRSGPSMTFGFHDPKKHTVGLNWRVVILSHLGWVPWQARMEQHCRDMLDAALLNFHSELGRYDWVPSTAMAGLFWAAWFEIIFSRIWCFSRCSATKSLINPDPLCRTLLLQWVFWACFSHLSAGLEACGLR